MKTRLLKIFAVLALLCTIACAKKTFVKLAEPAVVIQLTGGKPIDILQEPLKNGLVSWDETKIAAIEIEGALRVTYQKTDYFYWQLNARQN